MILSKSMQDMVDHFLHCIVVLKCNKHLIKSSICHFFQMVLDCQFEVNTYMIILFNKHIVMNF
jgi:hypothetical protein